jgi:hypothetical protein
VFLIGLSASNRAIVKAYLKKAEAAPSGYRTNIPNRVLKKNSECRREKDNVALKSE